MTAPPALAWTDEGAQRRARCGRHGDGIVLVRRARDGWFFRLDMLPADSEPLVISEVYLSPEAATRAAERQAEEWPRLIEGARRV